MINYLRSTPILVAAILLAFYADLLFYGKPLGLSLLLFVLFFVGVLFILGKRSGVDAVRKNLWLLIPLFFFAGMVAIRDNAFIKTLNVLAVTCLLAYLLLYYAAGRVGETGLMTATLLPFFTAGKSLLAARPIMAQAIDGPRAVRYSRSNLTPVVRGGLLAMPVVIIFTLLLASADIIFANQLAGLFSFINISQIFRLGFRGIFIFGIAWAMTGGLVLALDRNDHPAALEGRFSKLGRFRFLGSTEATIIFGLVNLLFLAFVLVQFRYLFGGVSNISFSGYTYAEYARRGFFELFTVAILSLGLILGLETLTWRESKRQFKIFNLLSSIMILLVVIMLVSAFRRMSLYEAAFGYTELRLTVFVFMIWLALFLLWFLFGLWHRPDRFALGALVVGMGFLVTLNLINPDAFIVRQNVARYKTSGYMDADYLNSLSADAVPALVEAVLTTEEVEKKDDTLPCDLGRLQWRRGTCDGERSSIKILEEGLQERYQAMQETAAQPWQSFQLATWRASWLLGRAVGLFPAAAHLDK